MVDESEDRFERHRSHRLEREVKELVAGIDDLKAAAESLEATTGQLVSAVTAAQQQVADLQAKLASDTGVTNADLEALAQSLSAASEQGQGVLSAAAAAGAAAGSAPAAPAPAVPAAPSGGDSSVPGAAPGGAPAAPAAPSPDPGAGAAPGAPAAPDAGGVAPGGTAAPDPGAGAPVGGVAPDAGAGAPDPSSPAPGQPSQPAARSVYTFDGDPSTVDPTIWIPTDSETSDGKPLYFYVGDTQPGDAKGDGVAGVWHLYTGATQAASGSSAASGTPEA